MRKRVLAFLIMAGMMVYCFTGCNSEDKEKDKTSKESAVVSKVENSENSNSESSAEESKMEIADYIPNNVKNTDSYKKMIAVGKGNVISVSSGEYNSEYYMFDDGEIGVVDKSTEKDNEYTYVKYTVGNIMYTVDIKEKLYAESDTNKEDGSASDKTKLFSDFVNYMYYGVEYMGVKDGVEVYNIPQYENEEESLDEQVGEENNSSDNSDSNTVSDSSEKESSEEESSKETDDMKRYIKIKDNGLDIHDYLNGKKQSTITITVRKINDKDRKQFSIDGCKKYEESSVNESSYSAEDLPDIPNLDESVESEIKDTESE